MADMVTPGFAIPEEGAAMSEMIYSRHHGGGLMLAEYAADERAVQLALKDFDDRLRLTWEVCGRTGRQVWNVVRVWSQEHPATQVLAWRENGTGEPKPLTMSIVDEVKRLRQVDTLRESDRANARLTERADRETFTDALEVATEFERLDRTGRIHVPVRTKRFGAGRS